MKLGKNDPEINVIYTSFQCSERKFEKLFRNQSIKPGQAVQKYNRLLAEGLASIENIEVTVVSELPIVSQNYSKKIVSFSKEDINGIKYCYLPLINIHRIKDMLVVPICFFYCIRLFIRSRNKKTIVISDILNAPVALGSLWAAKLFKIKYIAVVTDIPALVYKERDKTYRCVSNYAIQNASAYILLTEQMNNYIHNINKQYVIIEGLVDNQEKKVIIPQKSYDKKICMYTGLIDKKYGIEQLVKAFLTAQIKNSELHIYGDGDYSEELIEIAAQHKEIKYYGTVLSSYVVQLQKEVTLLVNPRPTGAEYTKYSFPSKNMEYMVSGTPVLTTNLPGMPIEYKKYVYLIDDESVEGLSEMLRTVLSKPREELLKKGVEAREFVLNNKNNIMQAQKVLEIL